MAKWNLRLEEPSVEYQFSNWANIQGLKVLLRSNCVSPLFFRDSRESPQDISVKTKCNFSLRRWISNSVTVWIIDLMSPNNQHIIFKLPKNSANFLLILTFSVLIKPFFTCFFKLSYIPGFLRFNSTSYIGIYLARLSHIDLFLCIFMSVFLNFYQSKGGKMNRTKSKNINVCLFKTLVKWIIVNWRSGPSFSWGIIEVMTSVSSIKQVWGGVRPCWMKYLDLLHK